MEDKLRKLFFVLVLSFVFLNIFIINIVIHEYGHFIAADFYDLEPRINFELENLRKAAFSLKSESIAFTSFIDDGNEESLMVIALLGPFFNLIFGIFFIFGFIFGKDRFFIKEICLIGAVVSIGSFIMNIIPLAGSDGALIFELLG